MLGPQRLQVISSAMHMHTRHWVVAARSIDGPDLVDASPTELVAHTQLQVKRSLFVPTVPWLKRAPTLLPVLSSWWVGWENDKK